ncbi:MAG TPA: hypothetical protein VGI39_10985, partial [Polyangiaceae bacterium]
MGLSPRVARGQPSEPESLLKQGIDLRRSGRDAEALDAFRRSYALQPSGRARAQVGLAEEALSDWPEAEEDIVGALALDDPWISRNEGDLKAALRDVRGHLASLEIRANVAGATLWIDGKQRAVLPMAAPLRVVARSMEIEIRAEGFEPQTQVVSLTGGGGMEQVVALRALPPPAAPPVPEQSAHETAALPAPAALLPVPPPRMDSPSRPTVEWTLLGAAATFLVGGVVAEVAAVSNASVYNDDARCLYGTLTRDQRCGAYRDRADAAGALAVAGFSVAAIAGVSAGILFVVKPR